MENTIHQLLITTVLIGVLYSLRDIIKTLFNTIADRFIVKLSVEEASFFYYSLQDFLIAEKSKHLKSLYYKTYWDHSLAENDSKVMFSSGIIFFKYINSLFIVIKQNQKITNSVFPTKNNKHFFYIFTRKKDKLLELIDYVEQNYGSNYIKYYFNNNGELAIGGKIINKTFDNTYLEDGMRETLENDLDKFARNKAIYNKLGIRYKRTYLFYGPPGTGKSSLGLAIANYTRRDVVSINMSKDMSDSDLIKIISSRPKKAIILFEDIDALFNNLDRENEKEKKDKTNITLSVILNILDGIYTPDDVLFVITTNEIDKLDDAIKRKGRTDILLEVTKPSAVLLAELKEKFEIKENVSSINEMHDLLTK